MPPIKPTNNTPPTETGDHYTDPLAPEPANPYRIIRGNRRPSTPEDYRKEKDQS